MNPKISIIIPTYNQASLLPRAIKSVLNQTFKDFELIIVDDGSTDDTKMIVDSFSKNDFRIKYIWQKNSGSPSKPRNTGIKHSRGMYICLLDSDDQWLAEKIEKQIKLFENSKKHLGLVSCNTLIIDEKSNKTRRYIIPRYRKTLEKLLSSNFIFGPSSVMIPKKIFDDIGLFDENFKYTDDYDMWIRISQKYNFDFVPEFLLKYYIHDSSITRTLNYLDKVNDLKYILEKNIKYYRANPKIHSIQIRTLGVLNIRAGEIRTGKEYFLKSIRMNPLSFKGYVYFFTYGSRLYNILSSIKTKLKK